MESIAVRSLRGTWRAGLPASGALAGMTLVLAASSAGAAQPEPWQLGFQPAASPVMELIHGFHDFVLPIITLISLLVLVLLIWVGLKYRASVNPTPSKTTHNTLIEVAWTVVPILILMVIALPSIRLLNFEERLPPADVTVKAIGYQWYWGYEYPDDEGLAFDANLVRDDAGEFAGSPRLLETDYAVVVPVGKVVRLQVTADPLGVIHNWAMPAFGIKIDAVPGRLNEGWFRADAVGTYYGQCSELCGIYHAYMPIMVKVVPEDVYAQWVRAAKSSVDDAKSVLAAYEAERATKLAAAQ